MALLLGNVYVIFWNDGYRRQDEDLCSAIRHQHGQILSFDEARKTLPFGFKDRITGEYVAPAPGRGCFYFPSFTFAEFPGIEGQFTLGFQRDITGEMTEDFAEAYKWAADFPPSPRVIGFPSLIGGVRAAAARGCWFDPKIPKVVDLDSLRGI